jgi:hypothetical protein
MNARRATSWTSIPSPRLAGAAFFSGSEVTTASSPGATVLSLAAPAPDGERFRRASRECVLGAAATMAAAADAGVPQPQLAGERTGLVYVSACAYAGANRAFLEDERSATLHFPYTAPSAVPAEVAIALGIRGPCLSLMGGGTAALAAVWQGASWLAHGMAERVLVLSVETMEEVRDLFARARRLYRPPLVEGAACLLLEAGRGRPFRWASAVPAPRDGGEAVARVLAAVLDGTRPEAVLCDVGAPRLARAEGRVLASLGLDRDGRPGAPSGERLACAPLVALARARAAGVAGACLVTTAWRGEYAAILWALDGGSGER